MIRAGIKLRAGCLALRVRWVEQVEHERDEALASRDEARELRQIAEARANGHQNTAHRLDEAIADVQKVLRLRGHEVGDEDDISRDVLRAFERDERAHQAGQTRLRRDRSAHQAHASHWRREVAQLVGVQAEGRADSDLLDLLRRLVVQRTGEAGTILDAWQQVCRLVDDSGIISPASIVDRVAVLVERGQCRHNTPRVGGGKPLVCVLQAGHSGAHGDHEGARWSKWGEPDDLPREAYDPAMGGDIEPPPGRDEPEQHWAEQAIERAREYLAALGYRSIVDDHGEDLVSMLREIGVRPAGSRSPHDPELVERLAAMTPSGCDLHDYAVFAEGGSAGPCPWCEVRRARDVLAPDVHTWDVPLARVAMTAIDQNRAMAVAAELRWWVAPGNASGVDRVPRSDLTRRADQLHPAGATPEGSMPPRPDIWMAEDERMSEVPF